jgi:UDPglucose 6-dehydrogenase
MTTISVMGTGYVGLVSGVCFADFGNHVICVDTDNEKIAALQKGHIPIYEPELDAVVDRNIKAGRIKFTTDFVSAIKQTDVIFIAVGTPPVGDGSVDLSYVEQVARRIGQSIEKYTVIVSKSTVPVGTGRKIAAWIGEELKKRNLEILFDIVSNPEFLREGTAVYDFTHPDRIIIGTQSEQARNKMKDVYRPLYLGETPFIETDIESAEMIKYAANAFLAMKIAFINEIANLCEKVGANVRDVAKAVGRDGRIGSKFLHPGPGYGGSCFPKDTKAIAAIGRAHDSPLTIVEAAIKANEQQKLKMVKKIEYGMGGSGSLNGKTIAILGLAFKNNTNDMRESPAITICEELARQGAFLRIWDPAAMREAAWRLAEIKGAVYFANSEYDALQGSHALILVTEWNQFRNMDLYRIKNLLACPLFFDLRNIYKREEVESAGLRYFGIGT